MLSFPFLSILQTMHKRLIKKQKQIKKQKKPVYIFWEISIDFISKQ